MAKAETASRGNVEGLNVDFMRSLVKQYSELGQWTSAMFWADAAAATACMSSPDGQASGDDIWLLASTMLARGELHRAAHAVTSRGLHRRHLLCLGVAMRAYVAAKEPTTALSLLDECEPGLLEPKTTDQTHNRALGGVLVWQARALSSLERRDAATEALSAALRADVACVEALHLLMEQHVLNNTQETELIDSLSVNSQLNPAEAALVRAAYRDRLHRHRSGRDKAHDIHCATIQEVEKVRSRTMEATISRARRLADDCDWAAALKALDSIDAWVCAEVRAACLVELKRSSELFSFAHSLVDAYPNTWQAWFAVGCYYYLIGKSEFARRYLSKAKSLEPGAGCVWLAYGHSFALDSEHDQAMAAYFKASQLMAGSHLPPLYVAVECSLLNNVAMCEKFFLRAALQHSQGDQERRCCFIADSEEDDENRSGWERISRAVRSAHVAHEAGVAALSAGSVRAAARLLQRALGGQGDQLDSMWAPTVDALGHAYRRMGQPQEALEWHQKALALVPGRPQTYAAIGLCLALLGRETEAADALHSALAKDPDDVVSLALLDAIVDRLDAALTDEEIPQFQFPLVQLPPPPASPAPSTPATPAASCDVTNVSDMSMSFD